MPRVASVSGTTTTTTSCSGSSAGSSSTPCASRPGGPGDHRHGRVERQHPAPDRLADVAGADHEHPLAGQLAGELLVPLVPLLQPDELREVPQRGEHRGQHPLGGRPAVHAAGVAERHPGRHQPDERVRAGRGQLHHLELRQRRELRLQPVLAQVLRDPEAGLGGLRRRRVGGLPDDDGDPVRGRSEQLAALLGGQDGDAGRHRASLASGRPGPRRPRRARPSGPIGSGCHGRRLTGSSRAAGETGGMSRTWRALVAVLALLLLTGCSAAADALRPDPTWVPQPEGPPPADLPQPPSSRSAPEPRARRASPAARRPAPPTTPTSSRSG